MKRKTVIKKNFKTKNYKKCVNCDVCNVMLSLLQINYCLIQQN